MFTVCRTDATSFVNTVPSCFTVFQKELDVTGGSSSAKMSDEASKHQKSLEKLYNHFVRQEGVRDSQCLVINQKFRKKDEGEDDDETYDGSSRKKKEVHCC